MIEDDKYFIQIYLHNKKDNIRELMLLIISPEVQT